MRKKGKLTSDTIKIIHNALKEKKIKTLKKWVKTYLDQMVFKIRF